MGIFDFLINPNPQSIEEAEENMENLNKKVVEKQNEDKKEEVDNSIFGSLFGKDK